MNLRTTDRGFDILTHHARPTGKAALWVGEHHHLYRDDVAVLVLYLMRWLETGRLAEKK